MLSPDLLAERAAALSLLGWWQDAGVDTLAADAPRSWLAPAPSAAAALATAGSDAATGRAAAADRAPPAPVALPGDFAGFCTWLETSAALPEAQWGGKRLAPSGDPAASLMILIDMPEPGDAEAGALLGGATGRLFDAMLRAIGRDRGTILLASLAATRPPDGRVPADAAPALADRVRHLIGLVAPQRLLLMGDAANRALVGADAAEARGRLHPLNLGGGTIAAVATLHPRLLLDRPAAKALAWRDLQMLTKEP
jgi:uracil-DNA glycosylase family 4